jgi:hypothetical protein
LADNLLQMIEVVGLSNSLAEARLAEVKKLIGAGGQGGRQTSRRERHGTAESGGSGRSSTSASANNKR